MNTSHTTAHQALQELVARGLTQTEISQLTGIPQPRICKWLNQGTPKSVDDGVRLLAVSRQLNSSAGPASTAPATNPTVVQTAQKEAA